MKAQPVGTCMRVDNEGKRTFPEFLTYAAGVGITREEVGLEGTIQGFSFMCYIWEVKYVSLEPRRMVRLKTHTCEFISVHTWYWKP